MGIKAFRDPALTHDFDAPRLPIDVADFHTYAVDWDSDEAVFSVDGGDVRRCPRPPTYPLQLMVAVYDFPEWSVGGDDHLVPELVVDHIAGSRYGRLTGRSRGGVRYDRSALGGTPVSGAARGSPPGRAGRGVDARPAAEQTAAGPRSAGDVWRAEPPP